MRIEIIADNGFINNAVHESKTGDATLVIVQVTLEDGKSKLIPYEANKPICQLINDIKKSININMNVCVNPEIVLTVQTPLEKYIEKRDKIILNAFIEREDLVKCVKVITREVGMDIDNSPSKGKIYRVIDIHKAGGEVIGYDVIDDVSGNKVRMPVFKDEVELHQKFVKPPPRIEVFSVTKLCQCGEISALPLNEAGDMYAGKCVKCGSDLVEARIMQHG